jgi:hypothetical protein
VRRQTTPSAFINTGGEGGRVFQVGHRSIRLWLPQYARLAGLSGEDLDRALPNGFRPLLHLVGQQVDVGVQRLVGGADDDALSLPA